MVVAVFFVVGILSLRNNSHTNETTNSSCIILVYFKGLDVGQATADEHSLKTLPTKSPATRSRRDFSFESPPSGIPVSYTHLTLPTKA